MLFKFFHVAKIIIYAVTQVIQLLIKVEAFYSKHGRDQNIFLDKLKIAFCCLQYHGQRAREHHVRCVYYTLFCG